MLRMSPSIAGPSIRLSPTRQKAGRWSELAHDSDCEDVQIRIGNAIRAGSIRVRPWPGDPERVRISPVEATQSPLSGDL